MPEIIDMRGQKIGRLQVIEQALSCKGRAMWVCECECGAIVKVLGAHLRIKTTRSCGCLRDDLARIRATKHNLSHSREYESWHHAKQRCSNSTNGGFHNYGGRGIQMSDTWKNSFSQFYKDMGPRPKGTTLERINNNLGYSPENCKWATNAEQQKNKRTNVFIEFEGARRIIADWAVLLGVSVSTLSKYRKQGWTDDKLIRTFMRAV